MLKFIQSQWREKTMLLNGKSHKEFSKELYEDISGISTKSDIYLN